MKIAAGDSLPAADMNEVFMLVPDDVVRVDARPAVAVRRSLATSAMELDDSADEVQASEAGNADVSRDLVSGDAHGAEAAADSTSVKSPETYVRHRRIERFASPGGAALKRRHAYAAPAQLALNEWALAGVWMLGTDAAVLNEARRRIVYHFHARDLHLIMGPSARGTSGRFRVLIDGRPPGAAHETDVDEQGYGTVPEQRLSSFAARSDRRSPVRDRVPRSRCRGIRIHVRLIPLTTNPRRLR